MQKPKELSDRERERADTLAWLRGADHYPQMKAAAKFFANLIEKGEHEGYADDD